tara:strand:+ start:395 stop:580 length:186 start_codon:yes stop_codon:yes gene_type:complete
MHPRERVISLAHLCVTKGEKLPQTLIDEARRLKVDLSGFVVTEEEETKPEIDKERPKWDKE